ncbi:hypothetical protein CBF23_014265 [Marinomonas agarivorans]|nr:hypothetical protein CBF23_014265 [Marinomonas agarivorans]
MNELVRKVFIRVFFITIAGITLTLLFHYDRQIEKKGNFVSFIEVKMKGVSYVELNLSELFNFKWGKACFSHNYLIGNLNTKVEFLSIENEEIVEILFDKTELNLHEEYVAGSPVGKCFSRSKIVQIEKVKTNIGPLIYLSTKTKGANENE